MNLAKNLEKVVTSLHISGIKKYVLNLKLYFKVVLVRTEYPEVKRPAGMAWMLASKLNRRPHARVVSAGARVRACNQI